MNLESQRCYKGFVRIISFYCGTMLSKNCGITLSNEMDALLFLLKTGAKLV
jgi:hypothetical protein